MQMTGNSMDLAIIGEGYFQITMPSGETGYTRDGSFQMNENGEMVTSEGYLLDPGIVIPEDAIDTTINSSGEVLVKIDGQTDLSNVGQIQLALFANVAGLDAVGDNVFLETTASGTATVGSPASEGYGSIQQAALESSNVDVVQEITSMIAAQRAYEMNSKVIKTGDEMMSTTTQLR
jgi:flagellar basal-body rod protein FlgG